MCMLKLWLHIDRACCIKVLESTIDIEMIEMLEIGESRLMDSIYYIIHLLVHSLYCSLLTPTIHLFGLFCAGSSTFQQVMSPA